MIRKHLGFGCNLLALGLFFPGIFLTMFVFNMEMAATVSGANITSSLIDKELSIITTVQELWKEQRLLVAALIFVFSICIPLIKTSIITFCYFTKNQNIAKRLIDFVGVIGKWSMADVFVVAIFLAILSTDHADTATAKNLSVFGFKIALELSTQTLSAAGEGLYYFTGYCILSLFGTQLTASSLRQNQNQGQQQTP